MRKIDNFNSYAYLYRYNYSKVNGTQSAELEMWFSIHLNILPGTRRYELE
ncbi:hypothetical protein JOC85_001423 [Bacillus mesophilus]|uniref:Uncharacterized protein n=1 Tax=Bacillus mesophilus TaxID=1808955 RepID=A0A6M0Q605_9BACI|nr:hypothetical protein [Bacillus mesophilus]MBM7660651.1 hypothetical protein [Bacillus mesophilus]NEY71801.1 hypothetical protein [Bacillus mesophilus]